MMLSRSRLDGSAVFILAMYLKELSLVVSAAICKVAASWEQGALGCKHLHAAMAEHEVNDGLAPEVGEGRAAVVQPC
jgi:hypothetical protein